VLDAEFQRLNLVVSEDTRRRLAAYVTELERWNAKINLTSLSGSLLVRRLVVEPIWIGRQLELSGGVADVGSGNGSPAIPLWLTRPIESLHLIEGRARRAVFLRHVVSQLYLSRVTVHRKRVEDLPATMGPLDWITLQAVAPDRRVIAALKRLVVPATRIAWITAHTRAPLAAASVIPVPDSPTVVWVFHLDQS
jgi:16S rRNA (guanine527-N7)-methyltransferase